MENIITKEYIAGSVQILRGLPGAGKTYYWQQKIATKQWPKDTIVCSIDDYMTDKNGVYRFRDYKIKEADELCFLKFFKAIEDTSDYKTIVIDNRNLQHIDFVKYFVIARLLNYVPHIKSFYDGGKTDEQLEKDNIHGVPATGKGSIAWCRKKWEGYSTAKIAKYVEYDRLEDIYPSYSRTLEKHFEDLTSTVTIEDHVCIP
jgi:hypothetical protein